MKPVMIIAIAFVLLTGISITSISAQSTEIPSWVKGVANFWAEGNIDDREFGEAISFLIEQEIIKVEMPEQTNNLELERKISELESENYKIKNEYAEMKRKISQLESENIKLKNEVESKTQSTTETKSNGQDPGFSGVICNQQYGVVKMSGKYTNDDIPLKGITLKLIVLDNDGNIVETGVGSVRSMDAYETKYFDAVAFYDGNEFASCKIQIESKLDG